MKSERITNIKAAENYLTQHGAQPLYGGKSGAQVYKIGEKYAFKRIRREEGTEELFASCRREVRWYECAGSEIRRFLPEILDLKSTEEEAAILMQYCQPLPRTDISTVQKEKIMGAIAAVHCAEIPLFLRQEHRAAQPFSDEQLREAAEGWRSVLEEHPGVFDRSALTRTAGRINELIRRHDAEMAVLNHGDFHWDNLLQNERGDIVLCDWQGVSAGAASGDLSFFFSRLRADGIQPDEREMADIYAGEIKRLSGRTVTWEELDWHIRAANIITSFLFWHSYLHGSEVGRVQEIYEKMTQELS